MTALIDALLRYSRLEQQSLPKTQVNLRALLDQVLTERLSCINGPLPKIGVELPFTEVCGEPASIRQALTNLVDNAVKFSRHAQPAEITIGGACVPGERIIWIQDNGIGFDPKEAERIFGLFERLHGPEEYEGTGIGLAIVKLIMEKLGGRVWAESSPGMGSRFSLAFPDKDGDAGSGH